MTSRRLSRAVGGVTSLALHEPQRLVKRSSATSGQVAASRAWCLSRSEDVTPMCRSTLNRYPRLRRPERLGQAQTRTGAVSAEALPQVAPPSKPRRLMPFHAPSTGLSRRGSARRRLKPCLSGSGAVPQAASQPLLVPASVRRCLAPPRPVILGPARCIYSIYNSAYATYDSVYPIYNSVRDII